MDLSEFELIGRIAGQTSRTERIEVGIGDDAAVISGRDRIVTSVDTAVSGVHFGADRPPAESARKAVAAALRGGSFSVKQHPGGVVSSWLHERAGIGDLIELGAPAGDFVLPRSFPTRLLFVAGGSARDST